MAFDANEILNAFRYGTPPKNHSIAVLTGREQELQQFKDTLESLGDSVGSVKLLIGAYGVGKSFLLESFKHIALTEDYVVSKFQVNNGFRLNKIEDIYYAIMHHLSIKSLPERNASFDDLFDLWIRNLQHVPNNDLKSKEILWVCDALSKFNRNYSRAFLTYIRSRIKGDLEAIQASSAWLSGEQHIPHAIKQKVDLIGAMDKHSSIDFLKAFVKLISLMDYKGLVVFIDETDLVVHERSDIRMMAYNNLKYLIDLTSSGELPGVLFIFSGTKDLIESTEKGVTILTPLSQRLNLSHKEGNENVWSLDPLAPEALMSLTDKILELYKSKSRLPAGLTAAHLYQQIAPEKDAVTRNYIVQLIRQLDKEGL